MREEEGGMNKKILIGVCVLLAGIVAGWYVFGGSQPPAPEGGKAVQGKPVPATTGTEETVVTTVSATQSGEAITSASVQYTDSGFVPNEITVKQGATVTFTNASSGGMWVASDEHPTHQLLPGFDQRTSVAKGGTYEYTFTNVGTWKYHNHVAPTFTGTVVVTE